MAGQMMRTSNYTEFDFHTDIRNLAKKIEDGRSEWFPDLIVGLTRGGLIPAVCLSHRLGVPMKALNFSKTNQDRSGCMNLGFTAIGNRILIVEDMVDTGQLLGEMVHEMRAGHKIDRIPFPFENIRVAVLINNTDVDKLFDTVEGSIKCNYAARQISREINKDWISYWWEKQD